MDSQVSQVSADRTEAQKDEESRQIVTLERVTWDGEFTNNSNHVRVSTILPASVAAKSRFVPNEGITLSHGIVMVNEIAFPDDDPLVIRLSQRGDFWAVGYVSGVVRVFSGLGETPTTYGSAANVLTLQADMENSTVTDIRFCYPIGKPSRKGDRIVTTYSSGFVRLWNYAIQSPVHSLVAEAQELKVVPEIDKEHDTEKYNTPLCISVSYDGLRAVTGGSDSVIRVYDLRNLKEINRCQASNNKTIMDGHTMRICAICYHSLGATTVDYEHIFVTGGWDDALMIWDDRFPNSLWQYHGTHICGNDAIDIETTTNSILAGNWSRDKALFAVYQFNYNIMNPETGAAKLKSCGADQFEKPIYQISQNAVTSPSMTYVAQWLDVDTILVGGGSNNSINIINKKRMDVNTSVHDCPGAIYSVAIDRPWKKVSDKDKEKKKKCTNYHIAVCSANAVYVFHIDRKVATN